MASQPRKRILSTGAPLVLLMLVCALFYRAFHHEHSNEELLEALRVGDTVAARRALDAGADPNTRGMGLQIDARRRSGSLIDYLRSLTTNTTEKNTGLSGKRLPSALDLAERTGKPEMIRMLLDRGADPNVRQSDGMTPLMAAAERGHTEIVNVLLDRGAKIDLCNGAGWNALTFALGGRSYETVQALRRRGASFRDGHESAQTALGAWICTRQLDVPGSAKRTSEIVEAILAAGASPNGHTSEGKPMLVVAAEGFLNSNRAVALRALLAHGADVNAQTPQGETALMAAARSRSIELAGLLLEHGADVNIKTRYGATALTDAVQGTSGPTGTHGADMRAVEMVRMLLAHGANVNLSAGDPPLSAAVEAGSIEIIKMLLAHGASIDARGYNRMTALITAASYGRPNSAEIVRLLLSHGANIAAVDASGHTALKLAQLNRNQAVARALQQAGTQR